MSQPIRVVLAKIGLDGHDRGIQVVARAARCRDGSDLHRPLANARGRRPRRRGRRRRRGGGEPAFRAHTTLVPVLIDALRARGLGQVLVIVGGIIPAADIPRLEALGVGKVFTPGAGLTEIADFIRGAVRPRGVAAEQSSPRESRP